MIDWTQPVETTEDPPRPVRVLATDFKLKGFPYLCAVDYGDYEAFALFSAEGWDTWRRTRLRNVAPPKPEPVLLEGWVNLYSDQNIKGTMQPSKRSADDVAREGRVECRRVAWMSDGSPVPASPEQFDQMREMAKLIRERDEWRTKAEANKKSVEYWAGVADENRAKAEALRAEVGRLGAVEREWCALHHSEIKAVQAQVDMRNDSILYHLDRIQAMKPVVDAAMAWEGKVLPYRQVDTDLIETVRAYKQTPKKTAAEAVTNVAEMMGHVLGISRCESAVTAPLAIMKSTVSALIATKEQPR